MPGRALSYPRTRKFLCSDRFPGAAQRRCVTRAVRRSLPLLPTAALVALVLTALLGVGLLLSSGAAQASEPSLILAAYTMPVEGGADADLVVALDRPAGPDGVTVDFTVSGGTATRGTDYTLKFTSVEIGPGASAGANLIAAIDDAAYEGDETIILVAASPALSLTSNALTLTVRDNEAPPNRDREALVAIYNATNGSNWLWSDKWLSDAPLGHWDGVAVENNRVTELYLSSNQLSGGIPWEHLTKLTELKNLILNGNWLVGSIPPELGRLTNLVDLRLHDNRLSGSIPSELGNLSSLEVLNLEDNRLTGSIPPELGSLAELQILDLDGNRLSGSIPAQLGSLSKLESLDLEGNQLTGSIPWEQLLKLTNLTSLELHDNQLTGSIPSGLDSLTSLEVLHLAGNQLTGSIPSELGSFTSLEVLNLGDNRLTGSIPPELGSLANLVDLRLQGNRLSGSIPSELGNLAKLRTFYLDGNRLNGCVPRSLHSASYSVGVDDGLSWCAAAPPPNNAPTVSRAIADATIVNESGTRQLSLTGVFTDADSDTLTVTAGSSDETKATVSVAPGYSSLTLSARARGTASITVTADDGNGGTVSDSFRVTVKAAPAVASAIGDISGLEAGANHEVSLSGVFSDPDGDALTISAASSDDSKATVAVAADQSTLTLAGAAEGAARITVTARDTDGNRVSDSFDVSVAKAPDLTSTPTPTPTPTIEPEALELSGAAARYDANGNGKIDIPEYLRALRDHAQGRIAQAEFDQVVAAWLVSAYG